MSLSVTVIIDLFPFIWGFLKKKFKTIFRVLLFVPESIQYTEDEASSY